MKINKEFLLKFFKFGIVGFSGLIVDFGITYIFKEELGTNKYIANGLGFIVAASSNFILNKIWTFQDKSEQVRRQYILFVSIAIVGLAINQLVLYILHDRYFMEFYLAKFFAIGVVTAWNFGLNHFYTFASERA